MPIEGTSNVNRNASQFDSTDTVNSMCSTNQSSVVQTEDLFTVSTTGVSFYESLLDPHETLASRNLIDPFTQGFPRLAYNDTSETTALPVATTTPRDPPLNARQQALLSLDLAAEKLTQGDGAGAAKILEAAAVNARVAAAKLAPTSSTARFLTAFAENAEARAASYREQAPLRAFERALNLNRVAAATDRLAQEFESKGLTSDAKLLRTIAADSRVQSEILAQGSVNTNVLLGQGISQTYQQIVNASFDTKINDARSWAWPWESQSPQAKLIADKAKMQIVFTELNRTMEETGTSLDRAWNLMFEDNTIDGWKGGQRVPGFATRNDAATFLRDNDVTRHLLIPFTDMARGLGQGNGATVEGAQVELIKALRNNGQWEIARAVLDSHLKEAKTPEGIAGGRQLDANETRQWLQAKASEFVLNELPILVLSGVVSGGLGTGARALALAASWGTRASRGVQLAVELGTFVPTERILNEAINGRRADWSAGALARDYAFTIGGLALFKGLGKGWQLIREGGFGRNVIGKFKLADESVELVTPEGIRIRMNRKEFEDLVTRPLETRAANSLSGALANLTDDELKALQEIVRFRQLNSLPPLDLTPRTGGPTGTVAYVKEGGKEFYGINTSLERDVLKIDTLALRKQTLEEIQTKLGKLPGATINGRGQFLTHAEAEALMKAQLELGTLPKKLTLYVDRPTCNMCSGGKDNGLPILAELYGVEELTVIDSLGKKLLVRPGQNTIVVK
jgi:hypothetical protein